MNDASSMVNPDDELAIDLATEHKMNDVSSTVNPDDESVVDLPEEGIAPQKTKENLSMEIETCVETKVHTAMDNSETRLKGQINRELSEKTLPLRICGIVFTIIFTIVSIFSAFYFWLVAPSKVKEWTKEFVAQNMNEPALQEAADRAITEKMGGYVTEQIDPLREEVSGFGSFVSLLEG